MTATRIFIVDDAEGIRSYLTTLLESRGYAVDTAEDGRSALELLDAGVAPDLVILDVMMPGQDGLATLKEIKKREPELPVVMLSVVGTASSIVEAMQLGASDYLNKPFDEADLERVLARFFRPPRVAPEAKEPILWSGASLAEVRALIAQIADTDVTVLIQGESGVGKEIVARSVHANSSRSKQTVREGQLRGAAWRSCSRASSSDTKRARSPEREQPESRGKFELARQRNALPGRDRRDEPTPCRRRCSTFMQDSAFSVDSAATSRSFVDVQILSATNRPLVEMVANRSSFREDLYFRLNVVSHP